MNAAPIGMTDDELEAGLRDLGAHLDLGPAASTSRRQEFVAAIVGRIAGVETQSDVAPTPPWQRARRRRTGSPRFVAAAAAAAAVLLLAGLMVVTPTREAIADWLGIGGVRITKSDGPPPTDGRSAAPRESVDLEVAARAVPFAVKVADPAIAGPPLAAIVDPAVPFGLIEIRYEDFTLVELASAPDRSPVLEKVVGPGTTITPVAVGDRFGLWISGEPHTVGYVQPDGSTDLDRVRRAGDVLLWEDEGVTYRIEGADSFDAALAMATSLR